MLRRSAVVLQSLALMWLTGLGLSVEAAMPAAGQTLWVQAKVTYTPLGAAQETAYGNTSQIQIAAVEAIALQGQSWLSRPGGTHFSLSYALTNLGNTTSTLNATLRNTNACAGYSDTADVANLRIVHDANGNGIVDPSESVVAAASLPGTFTLSAGARMLLVAEGDLPMTNTGGACVSLSLTNTPVSPTSGTIQQAVNTFISLADSPAVQISQTVKYSRALEPGNANTFATYNLTATNNGTREATAAQTITVDGNPMSVVLLRNLIPSGAQYRPHSLQASHAGALRLYRAYGAQNFAYTSTPAANVEILEVAVAMPAPFALIAGQSFAMSLDVLAKAGTTQSIDNVGEAFYGNVSGTTGAVSALSNHVLVPIDVSTSLLNAMQINVKAATPIRVGSGVYSITYSVDVKNTGTDFFPYVRIMDNLTCALNGDNNIASWKITQPLSASNNNLPVSPWFTGDAPCNLGVAPTETQTFLSGDSYTLAPGASQHYSFTVQVTQKVPGLASRLNNTVWFAVMTRSGGVADVIAAKNNTAQSLLVDPQGYVYNSITRQPIAGAKVTLTRQSCDGAVVADITPDQVFNTGYAYTFSGKSVSMVTGADGQYQLLWNVPPVSDICTYSVTVTPPAGYASSQTLPAQPGVYSGCGAVVAKDGIAQNTEPTTWYQQVRTGYSATHTPQECAVVHDNIPLDPTNQAGQFTLTKQANKTLAELGDFVDYQLKVQNSTGADIRELNLVDVLPPGFSYVKGSSRLNNVALPDPVSRADNSTHLSSLNYSIDNALVAGLTQFTLRYRLRIGPGVMLDNDAINTAKASARSAASLAVLQTNTAQARVRVSGGVFGHHAFALGKVWADCNRNGIQDGPQEPGIAGVRLYLENGVNVITDQYGRWSLYGLKPLTHVLRVDASTLPANAELAQLDNRQSGEAGSRFLDVKNGELVRADFAVAGCAGAGLMDEIDRRQKLFEKSLDHQLQGLVNARLTTETRVAPLADTRALPASGVVQGASNAAAAGLVQQANRTDQSLPLIAMPKSMAQGIGQLNATAPLAASAPLMAAPASTQSFTPETSPTKTAQERPVLGRIPQLSAVPLEEVIEKLPPKAAFIELQEGDTVLTHLVNVRVTGPQQSQLRLLVNNEAVSDNRVGKKSEVLATGLIAYEFIGVALRAGLNTLHLQATDEFGNVREQVKIQVRAPASLSRAILTPQGRLSADPQVPVTLQLKLTDNMGVPISARTMVTLDANTATWLTPDLSPSEPGVQIFVEGGEATVELQPPAQQGDVVVRIVSGDLRQEQRLSFLPALTPMQGIGIVEGVLDLSKWGRLQLNQPQASNAFEQVIANTGTQHGDARTSERAAFYFKGTIQGEYLLSTAYDSEKQKNERLFRDIRPDEFYPVYGDGSLRGYDAQSTGRLYVRIDKNRSFLLLGDFNTASSQEVRQLSQYSRALSGVQHRYQDDNVRIVSFYSQTNATQQVEEFQANGLSFYNLSNVVGNIRPGAEKVEILVRDRRQMQTILSTRSLAAITDYTFEPLTRRLYLVAPLSSFDGEGNPVSVRVTFELDADGPTYNVVGADIQAKVSENVQLGAIHIRDENPQNKREIVGLTGLARVGENTIVSAEATQTLTDLKGKGQGSRVSMRHDQGNLRAQAQIQKTDHSFDNLSAGASAGRSEAFARAEYALNETTRAKADALTSVDTSGATATGNTTSTARHSVSVALEHKLDDTWVGEIGARTGNMANYSTPGGASYGQFGSNASSPGLSSLGNAGGGISTTPTAINDFTTVRARLTARPASAPSLQVFGEVEQDVDTQDRHAATLGAGLGITESTRLYAQQTVSSLSDVSMGSDRSLRKLTTVGVDSAYMEGGRVYNEYRAYPTVAPQNASGIRNTHKLNEQWRVHGSLEHIQTVGAAPANLNANSGLSNPVTNSATATSATVGFDWVDAPWRASAATEQRRASTNEAALYSLATAWHMDGDITLLGRVLYTAVDDLTNASYNRLLREQIGLAWRPAYADAWNVLSRYEHVVQNVSLGTAASTDPFAAVAGTANTTVGTTETHIVSTHANWLIRRGEQLSLRWAAKTTALRDTTLSSGYWATLLHGRYTHDLNRQWDISVQAGALLGQGNTRQATFGVEVGYQVVPNLWVSGGYNILGLKDPNLTGQNYTNRGAYVRLRWKFDEATLQFGRVAAATTASNPTRDGPTTVQGGP